jgi:hypothetical protein
MHGKTPDLASFDLDLARVQAGPDVDAERANTIRYRERTTDSARGPVERGEKAIATGVHLAARVASQLIAHDAMVGL